MKLIKLIPLLLTFLVFTSNTYASKNCDDIKGNIVGKLFCKAKPDNSRGSDNTEVSTTETAEEKKKWKFWSRPEWTKKKN